MHACTEQRKRMLMDDTAVGAAAVGQDEIEAKTPATKHSFRGKKSLEAINIIYESVLPCPSFSFHHAIAQWKTIIGGHITTYTYLSVLKVIFLQAVELSG